MRHSLARKSVLKILAQTKYYSHVQPKTSQPRKYCHATTEFSKNFNRSIFFFSSLQHTVN